MMMFQLFLPYEKLAIVDAMYAFDCDGDDDDDSGVVPLQLAFYFVFLGSDDVVGGLENPLAGKSNRLLGLVIRATDLLDFR